VLVLPALTGFDVHTGPHAPDGAAHVTIILSPGWLLLPCAVQLWRKGIDVRLQGLVVRGMLCTAELGWDEIHHFTGGTASSQSGSQPGPLAVHLTTGRILELGFVHVLVPYRIGDAELKRAYALNGDLAVATGRRPDAISPGFPLPPP